MPNSRWPEEPAEQVAPHVRRLRQRALRERLRESLLFLPAVMLAGAGVLELALAALDREVKAPWLAPFELPPDAAITLLSTLAGATITTAGVIFSLLVVTLQLASGQFSPRVLRTFWRDRFGQVLVGLLLATFTFCVLALTQIDTGAGYAPTITVLGALGLALGSIIAIVIFLNRVSRQQYVGRIAESIADETLRLIAELPYGPHIGARIGEPVEPPDEEELRRLGAPLVVCSPDDGWIQQISRRAVIAAVPAGSVVRMDTRVGAYTVRSEPLATIWPMPPTGGATRAAQRIAEAVIIGNARTMQQDIDFGLRQLNDIGLRALSAAVNDPSTAIELILRLSSVMKPLLRAELPAQSVRDDTGRILLTPWGLDHAEYVRHAYGQLRRYASSHLQVCMAIVRSLRMLRAVAASVGHQQAMAALDEELRRLMRACERDLTDEEDLATLRAAAADLSAASAPAPSPALPAG